MSQRALVTGGTGLLGRQVIRAFEKAGWQVTGTGFSRALPPKVLKVDIQDENEVAKLLDEVKPQVVIHCAADRQPDSCTKNPEAAHRLNVTATEKLAQACSRRDAFLIYISTDYVFPGISGQAPYKATDETKPPNVYGETKRDGEDAVLRVTKGNAVVLRVPVLYGSTEPEDNNKESAVNVLMDVLWKSQDKQGDERVKMDDWAIRYPTNTQDVARVCMDVAKHYTSKSGEDLPSILQFSSEDRMTKYQICEKFSEIMDLPMDGLVPDNDGGKPGPDGTMRPYDCHLDTGELTNLGIDVGTVDFVAWWRSDIKLAIMSSSKRPSSKQRKTSRDQIPMESPTGSSDDMYGERLDAPQRVRKAPFPSPNSRYSSNSPPPGRRRNRGDSHTAERTPSPSRRLSDPFDDPAHPAHPAHPPRRPRSRSHSLSEQIEHGSRQRQSQDQRPSPQVARRGSRSRSRSHRSSPRPSAFSGSTLIDSSRPLPYSSGTARPQPRSPQPTQRKRPESRGDGCTNALMTRGERAQHGRAFTFFPCLREPVWETVVRRETIVIKKKKKGPDTSREGEGKKRK